MIVNKSTTGINPVATNKEIHLSWENIDVHAPPEKKGFCSKPKYLAGGRTHIIQNVTGMAKPGQILVIMGASGAGKTTLLNVLTCRNKGNLQITGNVKLNGKFLQDPRQLAAISSYVQQDDLFIGTLKVKEHLKFQAMLRIGSSASSEQKNRRVEQILNDLNLKKCENTLIGSVQMGLKGISSGEKRRLAFASEIITNPSILFCDEPTTGLDSFMALSIVETMKHLAQQGKTIICTIHQPSSDIFEMFDRLLLLAEGRVAYIGELPRANEFFSMQGYTCPGNYNPADFYIKTLAISPTNKEQCQEVVKTVCDAFETSNFKNELTKDINDIQNEYSGEKTFNLINRFSQYKAGFFTQYRWLIWRSFLNTMRNPMDTKINLIQTIFIGIMFGLIYLQLKLNQDGVQNINGVIFLILTNASFSNLFPVLQSFSLELPLFFREHHNGMYRVGAYFFSKMICELPKFIIIPVLFVSIVYWMAGLNDNLHRFVICVFVVILVSNSSVSFGYFISAAAPSMNAALGIAGPILVPLMIFSGYYLNNESIPVYLKWIKYLSWLNYSNEILIINQWENVTHIDCPANATRCFRNGDDIIDYYKMKRGNYELDFHCLTALVVGWRILAVIILNIKASLNK